MNNSKTALLTALGAVTTLFLVRWYRRISADRRAGGSREPETAWAAPSAVHIVIGFITNFLDVLGIGSFATTTSLFKLLRIVPDERIPGTLMVGHGLAVITQAFIFVTIVQVDATTLVTLIAAATAGAWLGAGVVASLPRRAVQVGMGIALVTAAAFMSMTNLGWFPGGGTALGLSGPKLGFAILVNVLLGSLLTLGVGNYAPSLILFSLLGMNPRGAFPIMMGSGAFPATVAGIRFVETGRYHLRAALGLTCGGIPGVLVAALLVKSLPLEALRWMVVLVVVYTSITMLRSAAAERRTIVRDDARVAIRPVD